MPIFRRALLAMSAAALIAPSAASAEAISLQDLSSYLNGIATAEAPFTQINSDGSVSTGRVFIHRPGRARFEYDRDDLLVLAGGGQLAIFDGRGADRPEQYPLRETPLRIILQRDVDLSRSGMVTEHGFDGTSTRVVAQDPDRPEVGTITLVFTPDPIELRQWVVTDEGGEETTVVLGGLATGGAIPAGYFSIVRETQSRTGD